MIVELRIGLIIYACSVIVASMLFAPPMIDDDESVRPLGGYTLVCLLAPYTLLRALWRCIRAVRGDC